MTLYVAVILLGQVGNGGQAAGAPAPPATTNEPPAVRYADQSEASPAAPPTRPAAPLRPRTEIPSRPAVRSEFDSVNDTPTTTAPPERSPPFRPQQPAEIATPAIAAAPAVSATAAQDGQSLEVASTMMAELLVPDEQPDQKLRRVRLIEAVSRMGDANLQAAAIRSYWNLAQAIATVRFAADKSRVLNDVPAPATETDRVLFAEALEDAAAEEIASHDALLAAQYSLLRVTGLTMEDALPWPADSPLVAPYRTQFNTIFANHPAPISLRQINHSLPTKLSLIEKRVTAMGAAESAADSQLQNYKRGGVPLVQLLSSIERLDRSRRAFVNSVVEYNHQIAEYSLAVVGSGVGSETLVATLIKPPSAKNAAVEVPRDVRQAGAAAPARERGSLR